MSQILRALRCLQFSQDLSSPKVLALSVFGAGPGLLISAQQTSPPASLKLCAPHRPQQSHRQTLPSLYFSIPSVLYSNLANVFGEFDKIGLKIRE